MAEKDNQANGAAAAKTAPTRNVREKPLPPLHFDRIQSSEYARNIWIITPEVGTAPEELLAPDYWSNLAHKLKQRDRIEAWAEDLRWYAEYLVLDVGRNWAKVYLCEGSVEELREFEPKRANMIVPGHEVEYAGLHAKWRVKRLKDSVVLKDRCETEGEAISWLVEHAKSLAA